ncbi:omega-conotoxin-like protein 1 [Apis florea]|uniref:omega-conotoxin-like protein 1 n=1 Tax=Apis florea TaxID=7463 RepID=UPI000252AECE|nr:omega-conotoxin-like protein 1 [Apis florea]
MSKFLLLVCILLLTTNIVSAASKCGRHGDSCISSSDCCPGTWCHTYANRCQVRITEEELMKQREKILGRKGKDY